jgi:hypothetical protein
MPVVRLRSLNLGIFELTLDNQHRTIAKVRMSMLANLADDLY